MKHSYKRNIFCLYLIKLSKWLMLIMPIVALFYNDNGLNDLDIFLLQAVYSLSVALLEIPSGYLADVVGRKKTLILGSILGSAGFLIYSISHSFTGFLIAEIILGLGGSFISGADSALLFDSLAVMRMKHRYLQFEGRITSIGNFAETAAAVCGGALAAYLGYRAVYISQTLIATIAIPASILLIEPQSQKQIIRPGFSHIISVCKSSIFVDRKLGSTILLSAITGVATLCMAWTAQIYFVENNFDERIITPLWVLLNLTVALIAALTPQTIKLLGKPLALLLIVFFLPTAYILLGILPLIPGILVLFIFYGIRGYATPLLKDFINQNCKAEVRATVLSIRSLFVRFGFAVLGPTIGWISGKLSLSAGLTAAGCILLVFASFAGFQLFRYYPDSFRHNLNQ